jgi:hypothetical protein
MSATSSGYDHVKLLGADGAGRTITRQEYEKIPLNERIGRVLRAQIEFYRKGVKVPAFEALKVS